MKKRKFIYILIHLVFWTVVTCIFLRNSFLRPVAESVWMECAILFIIASSFYLSYFALVPKLLMRRHYLFFLASTLLLIIIDGSIELLLLKRDMMGVFNQVFTPNEILKILWITFFFLCLRNACFIIVGDIAKLCELQAIQLQQRNKAAIEMNDGCIFVDIPSQMTALLAMDDIAYLTYEKRRVTIVRKTAPRIYTYASLTYFEEHLPSDQFVRINRNTIAAYSVVESYNETTVCLVAHNIVKDFPIQPTKSEDILDLLQAWNPSKYQPD